MKQSLLELLREGGYILYTRHGEATVGEDQLYLNFWNCTTQRNLSETGRKQAVFYGELLRKLRIPVSYPILSSPFCRTKETAQLAFGWGNIQIEPFLAETYKLNGNLTKEEQERILEELTLKIEMIPPRGSNRVMIAHGFPEGIGLGQIQNMGTVIIKPLGRGNGYEIIKKLSLEEFADNVIINKMFLTIG